MLLHYDIVYLFLLEAPKVLPDNIFFSLLSQSQLQSQLEVLQIFCRNRGTNVRNILVFALTNRWNVKRIIASVNKKRSNSYPFC